MTRTTGPDCMVMCNLIKANGQKRVYLKTIAAESVVGDICLAKTHLITPVFGQKRMGAPDYSYFAQLPPVFGHFMFFSGGLLDYPNRSTRAARTINCKILPG